MSGGSLATKGVVGGGGSGSVTVETALPPPPDLLQNDVRVAQQSIVIVVPTAPNICLMVAENIVDNLRVRQAADLQLPSLYKRAYLIAHETDEIAVVKG
jgi:hypothetical protein